MQIHPKPLSAETAVAVFSEKEYEKKYVSCLVMVRHTAEVIYIISSVNEIMKWKGILIGFFLFSI